MPAFAKLSCLVSLLWLLGGCAAGPKFDAKEVDETLTPQRAAAEMEKSRNSRVIWGGLILSTHNLKDATQIEVLAYPLERSFQPDSEAAPLGRFLIVKPGYVETADYVTGRAISVSGILQGTQEGKIGEVVYVYPVIQPTETYLWPRGGRDRDSNLHFGFGLSIIR